MTKYINILIKSSLNFDAVFVKDLALTTVSYMVESWKESLDPGGHYSAQLTDPSKAFDWIINDLLIAKLQA